MTGVGSAPAAGASAGAASPPSAASAEEQITPASSLGLLREEAGDASLSLSDPCEAESADRSASLLGDMEDLEREAEDDEFYDDYYFNYLSEVMSDSDVLFDSCIDIYDPSSTPRPPEGGRCAAS